MLPGKQIESSLWLNLTENKSEVKLLTIWKRGGGGGISPKKYVYFTDYLNV